jgi:alpha-tubulin suppressor-like RCC1 family protein
MLYCWGANESSQCGTAPKDKIEMPIPVVPPSTSARFAEVAAGDQHTCARGESDGQIYCWGANAAGQLGTGRTGDPVSTPTRVELLCQ